MNATELRVWRLGRRVDCAAGQPDIPIMEWFGLGVMDRHSYDTVNIVERHAGDRGVVCSLHSHLDCERSTIMMASTPNAGTTTSDPGPPPSLQDRIQTLTDVHNRLQTLRHVPTMLLRPPSTSPLAVFPPSFDPTIDREFAVTFNFTPTHDFRALKEFVEVLRSDKVQEALRAARASEDADQGELGLSFRRENRKHKYVCTSGSR